MTVLFRALAGLIVLALSFGVTLLIINYWTSPASSDMELAMAAEGITATDAIVGSVDVIKQDPDGRVELSGWAFDKELAEPVRVLVLVGSKLELVAVTNGARDDVTRALHEAPERTKNVAFTGRTERPLDCGTHLVVGVNQSKHMSLLMPMVPPQCGSRYRAG